jgi:beta-phosphoglucomutase family hydrolase
MAGTGFAVIFDMDGVMVDNSSFHKKAWREFGRNHGFELTEEQMKRHIHGRNNTDALRWLFGRELTESEVADFVNEKENLYRKAFAPHLRPVKGLAGFVRELERLKVPMAVGTAAPPENVDFVLGGIGLRDAFKIIVDDTQFSKSKPDPDVYLKCAARMGVRPSRCVVFEDSPSGIMAAKNAGMKVVGVATTSRREELPPADMVVDDFTGVTVERLRELVNG